MTAADEDFDGPFVPFDLEKWPGHYEREWVGPERWRTRHGPAIVCWSQNEIARADNVRLDDGARMSISGPRVGSLTSRIPSPTGQGFIQGLLVTYPDDVEFVALARNYRNPPREEVRPAFEALRNTSDFMRFLASDQAHAYAAYTAIQNRKLTLPDGAVILFGQRSAAGLIAALRDNGEDYLDYFANDDLYDDCLAHLSELQAILERNGFAVQDR